MHRNKIDLFFCAIIFMFIGNIATVQALDLNVIGSCFFDCRLIEIIRLFVMVFLGCYVAYWVSIKSNLIQKKKDLCLVMIAEGSKLVSEQEKITLSFVKQKNGKKDGKLVLSGFKRLSNKLNAINKICKDINKDLSTVDLIMEFKDIKELVGEKYMLGFSPEDANILTKGFDKFEKMFDDIRIKIML